MYTMMTILIFVAILFVYLHVQAQWKTSDDLEIYEADYETPNQLQEIVAVKQPVMFKIIDPEFQRFCDRFQLQKMEKYDNVDVHVKEIADYYAVSEDAAVDSVSIPLRSAITLLSSDAKSKYFSETNGDFVEESGVDIIMQPVDAFLKPALTAYTKYDLLFGSPHAQTPLRYHTWSQQYLCVTRGKIRVKMCPPKYRKILPLVKDYENYEFRCSVEPTRGGVLDKVKFLDFEVHAGSTLFIPPYWWYSITFSSDSTVGAFVYDHVMNICAQMNHWVLYYLQQSNITMRLGKTNVLNAVEEEEEEIETEVRGPKEIVTNANIYVTGGDGLD
jgi:quercetin dioxygenase-like cupin family protein/predicted DNA-binding protein YlxM (UPF0122 family)